MPWEISKQKNAKFFSREIVDNFTNAKVFSRKKIFFQANLRARRFVQKAAKRESLCPKFRVFFGTRKFLPAKISALKVKQTLNQKLTDKCDPIL